MNGCICISILSNKIKGTAIATNIPQVTYTHASLFITILIVEQCQYIYILDTYSSFCHRSLMLAHLVGLKVKILNLIQVRCILQ